MGRVLGRAHVATEVERRLRVVPHGEGLEVVREGVGFDAARFVGLEVKARGRAEGGLVARAAKELEEIRLREEVHAGGMPWVELRVRVDLVLPVLRLIEHDHREVDVLLVFLGPEVRVVEHL